MSRWVNNDWETNGVRTVNACPQPGYAEAELADDHDEIIAFERRANGVLTAAERVNRDVASRPIQAIIAALNNEARIRQILAAEYSD